MCVYARLGYFQFLCFAYVPEIRGQLLNDKINGQLRPWASVHPSIAAKIVATSSLAQPAEPTGADIILTR